MPLSIIWFHSCIRRMHTEIFSYIPYASQVFVLRNIQKGLKGNQKIKNKTKKNPICATNRSKNQKNLYLCFFVSHSQAHKGAGNDRSQEKNNRNGDHHTESGRRQAHTIAHIRIGQQAASRMIRNGRSTIQFVHEILRDAALTQFFVQRIQDVHIDQ